MLTHTLVTLVLAASGAAAEAGRDLAGWGSGRLAEVAGRMQEGSQDGPDLAVRYEAEARRVSNWRLETAADLEPRPMAVLAALVEADRPVVTRCVRLNNYWCIKSARWLGEIGTDEEGHVGFASAERSADAAATLLRRYYLEFGRKSALDIVRRWAPAECSTVASAGPALMVGPIAVRGIGGTVRARYLASRRVKITAQGAKPPAARPPSATPKAGAATATAGAAPARPPAAAAAPTQATAPKAGPVSGPKVVVPTQASASRGASGSAPAAAAAPARPAGPRVSAVIPRTGSTFRVPEIAAGLGERTGSTLSSSLPYRVVPPRPVTPRVVAMPKAAPARPAPPARAAPPAPANPTPTASLAASAPAVTGSLPPAPPPAPQLSCAPDEQRLRNYAGRIVDGLGLAPTDDLKLFLPDGTPTPNLAPVLLAMSGFELGTLRASATLVEGAVERQTLRARALAAAEGEGAGDR